MSETLSSLLILDLARLWFMKDDDEDDDDDDDRDTNELTNQL